MRMPWALALGAMALAPGSFVAGQREPEERAEGGAAGAVGPRFRRRIAEAATQASVVSTIVFAPALLRNMWRYAADKLAPHVLSGLQRLRSAPPDDRRPAHYPAAHPSAPTAADPVDVCTAVPFAGWPAATPDTCSLAVCGTRPEACGVVASQPLDVQAFMVCPAVHTLGGNYSGDCAAVPFEGWPATTPATCSLAVCGTRPEACAVVTFDPLDVQAFMICPAVDTLGGHDSGDCAAVPFDGWPATTPATCSLAVCGTRPEACAVVASQPLRDVYADAVFGGMVHDGRQQLRRLGDLGRLFSEWEILQSSLVCLAVEDASPFSIFFSRVYLGSVKVFFASVDAGTALSGRFAWNVLSGPEGLDATIAIATIAIATIVIAILTVVWMFSRRAKKVAAADKPRAPPCSARDAPIMFAALLAGLWARLGRVEKIVRAGVARILLFDGQVKAAEARVGELEGEIKELKEAMAKMSHDMGALAARVATMQAPPAEKGASPAARRWKPTHRGRGKPKEQPQPQPQPQPQQQPQQQQQQPQPEPQQPGPPQPQERQPGFVFGGSQAQQQLPPIIFGGTQA